MKKIIALLFIITIISCENNNQIIEDQNNLLIGNWVNANYKDGETTFSRSNSLPDNDYGISFEKNGDYNERSSGWCGTPPLSYFNINGSFKLEDNLITISKENYSYSWRIVSLSETNLVVKRELTPQEIAHQELMVLFNDIQNLSYSLSCTDSSNWAFVGYGSKACGGFQGYIPYSKGIDTVLFLSKVDTYTNAENDYNKKFNIVSDCSLIAVPKSVECKNGYPTLNF